MHKKYPFVKSNMHYYIIYTYSLEFNLKIYVWNIYSLRSILEYILLHSKLLEIPLYNPHISARNLCIKNDNKYGKQFMS